MSTNQKNDEYNISEQSEQGIDVKKRKQQFKRAFWTTIMLLRHIGTYIYVFLLNYTIQSRKDEIKLGIIAFPDINHVRIWRERKKIIM